jgi:hypothetical protein
MKTRQKIFFFFFNCLALKTEAPRTLETSGTAHPDTQRNTAEGLNLQPQGCHNFN